MSGFSSKEKQRIATIKINAIPFVGFSQAGAYINTQTKQRYVVLSCGHMAMTGFAADAVALASLLEGDSHALANANLENYLRYLVYAVNFKKPPSSFMEFLRLSVPESKKNQFHLTAAGIRYQMAASVLFHEFGHHVFGHTESTAYTASYSREREKVADKWAARQMLKRSMTPMAAIPLFYMLNQTNESDLKDEWKLKHPASMKRALYFAEASLKSIDDPVIRAAIKSNQAKTGLTVAGLKQLTSALVAQMETLLIEEEQRINHPDEYWLARAGDNNNRAIMELGKLYFRGHGKLAKDLTKSRFYLCKAARQSINTFDLVTAAQANYYCGFAYANWQTENLNSDRVKAKYYLNQSAQLAYIPGQVALRHFFNQ